MGGPKALLLVDGKPLIWAHVQRLREVSCQPIIVVTRAAVAAALGDMPGVRILAADTGSMAASLSVAVRDLSPEPSRVVVVVPIDTLPVRRTTLQQLLTAATTEHALVATPQYRGQSGHPVALREHLIQVFREGYTGTLRDVVRSAGTRRRRVEVDDPAVRSDLNTPADLAALRPGLLPAFAARGVGFAHLSGTGR